jgi:hypothetical protein
LKLRKSAAGKSQKIIMGSDEHFLGPILAHDNFLLAASKKPAFLANMGYVKETINP